MIGKAKLVSYSKSASDFSEKGLNNTEDLIAFCARVSNPNNQLNKGTNKKLIKYLIDNKHFSPLEMVSATIEVETTRDIARQMLRHRSFSFQEFCIEENSLITVETPIGDVKQIPIKTLFKMQDTDVKLRVYNLASKEYDKANLLEVFDTGVKPVYEVTFEDGKSIQCTKEHRFLGKKGFQSLEKVLELEFENNSVRICNIQRFCLLAVSDEYRKVKYKEVVSVEYIGDKQTYDIEVEHLNHNYVANNIIVHNSQRYADPTKDLSFTIREARLQDTKNRQNSISVNDSELSNKWAAQQQKVIDASLEAYNFAIENGIAKEQARVVLPEGNTTSRLYMAGTIRSWLHYIELRTGNGTQLEHIDIANKCAEEIIKIFPLLLGDDNEK